MTERTHDMAGFTVLIIALVLLPLTPMSLVTFAAVILANQIGTAVPDLDQPTAEFYRELPAGSLLGRLICPLLGSHRFLSHSFLGLAILGYLFRLLLGYLSNFILIDMNLVWYSFLLGYVSHLVTDSCTKEGVPWFFPLPYRFGFPPLKFLRVTTGKWMETLLVYPALVVLNGYLIYTHYGKVVDFFSNYLSK